MALLREQLAVPRPERMHWLFEAFERGMAVEEIHSLTKIDPWFLRHLEDMAKLDGRLGGDEI